MFVPKIDDGAPMRQTAESFRSDWAVRGYREMRNRRYSIGGNVPGQAGRRLGPYEDRQVLQRPAPHNRAPRNSAN